MRTPSFIIPLTLSALLLSACGGGGGQDGGTGGKATVADAEEPSTGVFKVNPGATWKPLGSPNDRQNGSLASIALSRLHSAGVVPGSVLSLQALGTFKFNATGDLGNNVTALFVDKDNLPLPLSAGATLPPATIQAACQSTATADPFQGDFQVPAAAPGTVTVPQGAVALWVSVDDCRYDDNADSSDPLRVRVSVVSGS